MKLILEEKFFSKANKKTLTKVSVFNAIALMILLFFPASIISGIATIILLPGLFLLTVLLLPVGSSPIITSVLNTTIEGILAPLLLIFSTIISILFYTSCIRGFNHWRNKRSKKK